MQWERVVVYDGGMWSPAMAGLMTVAGLGFATLAAAVFAKDATILLTSRLAQFLVVLIYAPLSLVVVDETTDQLDTSRAAAWLLGIVVILWLVTVHAVHWWRRAERVGFDRRVGASGRDPPGRHAAGVSGNDGRLPGRDRQDRVRVGRVGTDQGQCLRRAKCHSPQAARHPQGWGRQEAGSFPGWRQFIDQPGQPSPVGSAYGLRIASALDIHDPRLDLDKIVAGILASQSLPSGGWASPVPEG